MGEGQEGYTRGQAFDIPALLTISISRAEMIIPILLARKVRLRKVN